MMCECGNNIDDQKELPGEHTRQFQCQVCGHWFTIDPSGEKKPLHYMDACFDDGVLVCTAG